MTDPQAVDLLKAPFRVDGDAADGPNLPKTPAAGEIRHPQIDYDCNVCHAKWQAMRQQIAEEHEQHP